MGIQQQEKKSKNLACWGWMIILFSLTDLFVNVFNNKDGLLTANISSTLLIVTLVIIGLFTLIELIAGFGLLRYANGGAYSKGIAALLWILFIFNFIGLVSIIYGVKEQVNDIWSIGYGLRGTLVALFALINFKKYKNA